MVRPDLKKLYFIGFMEGFIIRDEKGNIFFDNSKGLKLSHKQLSLNTFNYSRLLYVKIQPSTDRNKHLTHFIKNINNYNNRNIVHMKETLPF